MIRRSFRIGLWLGLIAGVTAAVVKLVQARQAPPEPVYSRPPSTPARPWPRLEEPAVAPEPAAAAAPSTTATTASAPAAAAPRVAQLEREPVRWADAPVTEVDLAPRPEPKPEPRATPERVARRAPEPKPAPKPAPAARVTPPAPAPAPAPAEPPVKKSARAPKATAPRRQLVAKKSPARKAPAKKVVTPTWVDPKGNVCPKAHPVKAKLSSKIFQLPGMFAYDRTNPDRCYRDAEAAETDGFRAAKR